MLDSHAAGRPAGEAALTRAPSMANGALLHRAFRHVFSALPTSKAP